MAFVREIYSRYRESNKGRIDIHTRLMRQYKDIPDCWFHILLGLAVAISLVLCTVLRDQIQMPWWGLLFSCALAFIFTLPISIITATTNQGEISFELDCKGSIEVETPSRKQMFVAAGCEVREGVTSHWVHAISNATLRIWNGAVIRQLKKIKLIKYAKGKFHVIYEYYATNLESVLRNNIDTFFERIGGSKNYRFSDTFQDMISELLEGCKSMRNDKMSVGENNFRRRVVFLKDHVDYYRAPKFVFVEDQDPKNPYSSFLGLQKMLDTSHCKHAMVSSFLEKIYDRK